MLQGYLIREIRKASEAMEYPYRLALWKRRRFLQDELARMEAEYEDEETDCPVHLHILLEDMRFIRKELPRIDKEIAMVEAQKDDITPQMIERAKSTPIETIVEFKRGRAHCINPDHADRNPSMFHGTKTNQAICPACGQKYDSIAAYQVIWNVDFKQAVRRLQ